MASIRNSHAKPPVQKEAVMAEDIIAMVETLYRSSLRSLRDRAMLLIGFAGGLRRSEIVGLDLKSDQTQDGRGWIEILDKGMLLPCAVKPDGERSRSAAALPTQPARSQQSRPGSSSPNWCMPPFSPGDRTWQSCRVGAAERQGGRSSHETDCHGRRRSRAISARSNAPSNSPDLC